MLYHVQNTPKKFGEREKEDVEEEEEERRRGSRQKDRRRVADSCN